MNIIVTGASQGIGSEVVKSFGAGKGNKVIGIARNKKRLVDLADLIGTFQEGAEIVPVPFDLSKTDRIKRDLVPVIEKHMNCVDILINNAGFLTRKSFQTTTLADVEMSFTVNFIAPYFLIQGLMDGLLASNHPHILNISSMGGFQGSVKFEGLSAYSASKAALACLTECLAAEFRETQIAINCLAIGSVRTEMLEEAFPGYTAPVSPLEMAGFIKDFAINGYRYFRGKIIPVAYTTP